MDVWLFNRSGCLIALGNAPISINERKIIVAVGVHNRGRNFSLFSPLANGAYADSAAAVVCDSAIEINRSV